MAQIYYENIRSKTAHNETKTKNNKTESQGSFKLFKFFIVLAFIVLSIQLIWFLGITPFRPFTRIDITGTSLYDNESLLAYAGITSESSFILTNAAKVEEMISVLPLIESVRVIKRFPGSLEINLLGRQAAALAFANRGGLTIPVVFDRKGVIFQIGMEDLQGTIPDLPVISGIMIEQPVLGMSLPARIFPLLENLDAIRMNAPELLSAVSEIRIDRTSSDGIELTLFLIHHRIRVLLTGLNEDILRYTLLMADVLSERDPHIALIDFRGAVASYYPRVPGGWF